MANKRIIPIINGQNEVSANIISLAIKYANNGADEIILYDYSLNNDSIEKLLVIAKEITKQIDIPLTLGLQINRFEDVKKALYTGAHKVMIKYASLKNEQAIKEATERFGLDKIIVEIEDIKILTPKVADYLNTIGVYGVLIKHITVSEGLKVNINSLSLPVIIRDSLSRNDLMDLLSIENTIGIATNYFEKKDIMKSKNNLKKNGFNVNTFESKLDFSEFKLDEKGLIPVIVQDYKTNEVLMLAYMNEMAFEKTIETGIMTYYSRSRNEQWIKGQTSGHYQYMKSLDLDCDNDTILAKVSQVGVACHTGAASCFFKELVKKEYDDINPLTVFSDVYNVITDRKNNPKEGSYTNYLFEKGIDKILKKCGEEATEIIIAAKNPDSEELKYEISDFLYHVMVLMVDCGLDWSDVTKELAHRR